MDFNKSELLNNYYWVFLGSEDPRNLGPIDATLLSRKERFKVLYLMKFFMEVNNLK